MNVSKIMFSFHHYKKYCLLYYFTQGSSKTKCIFKSYKRRDVLWIICKSDLFFSPLCFFQMNTWHSTVAWERFCLLLRVEHLTDRQCHGASWDGNVHPAGRTCVQRPRWSEHGPSDCTSTLFTTCPTSTHASTCPSTRLPTWAGVPGSAWPARNQSAAGSAWINVRLGDG